MERVNGKIIFSVLILMGAGVYRLQIAKKNGTTQGLTLTRVLVGGYILAILASLIDLVGGGASAIAGGLLGLAVVTALLAVLPDLLQRIAAWRSTRGKTPTQGMPPTIGPTRTPR